MFKWGTYAEGASAGRMSRTGPSHISNTVLSIVKIGPPMPASFPAARVSLSSNDDFRYGVVVSCLINRFPSAS